MPKTTVCTCTEKTSKQQKSRCRSKRECKFPPQQVGRKPSEKKQDLKEIRSRYDNSDKGKIRKARYRRRKWVKNIKAAMSKLPPNPRVSHLVKKEGTWTPVPPKAPPMAEPLPARKRAHVPRAFWWEVKRLRKAAKEKRKLKWHRASQ